ncbi:MAG: hypothetical protein ACI4DY_01025 [Monoglobaceae bacterium]
MKKIALTLIFATTLFLLSFPAYADSQSVSETKAGEEIKLLTDLNFINKDADTESFMTRDEFAEILERVVGYNSDNPLESMCDMGYMKTYPNGNMGGNEYLTYEQAQTALVCVLGYEMQASSLGGYPKGYTAQAAKLGITKGISNLSANGKMSAETVYKLIYNSLDVPMCVQNSYSLKGSTVKIDKDSTILSVYHNIYKSCGVLDDNGISRLYIDSGNVGRDQVGIDGRTFDEGSTNAKELLGCCVEYWYEDVKNASAPLLRSIRTSKSKNKILKIDGDDIADADYDKIEYFSASGKRQTAQLAKGYAVIYNGAAYPNYKPKDFMPDEGYVELISTNGGKYNTIRIWDYKNYMVEDYNIDTYELRAKFGKKIDIDPTDQDTILDITNTGGEKCFAVDINEGTVISVAESKNEKYKKIILSKENAEGKITAIHSSDRGRSVITVGGADYEITDDYSNSSHIDKCDLNIGFIGVFYLNAYGRVVYAERKGGDMEVGYLIDCAKKNDFFGRIKLKIFTENGETKVFECSDNLKIDGSKPANDDVIADKLASRQLLRYMLDSDGYVSSIDLAYSEQPENGEGNQTLHMDYDGSSGMFYRSTNGFNGKVFVSSSTKVFKVPPKNSTETDPDYFKIMSGTGFLDKTSYKIGAYSVNTKSFISDYIVYYSDKGISKIPNGSRLMLVGDVSCAYENEDEITVISGIRGGTTCRYTVKDTTLASKDNTPISEVSAGDVIRVFISDNRIEGWEMIYDYDKALFNCSTDSSYGGELHMAIGSVTAMRDNIMEIARNAKPDEEGSERLRYKASGYQIMVYDTRGRKPSVYKGKYTDIKSYEDYGDEYSNVVIFQEWGDPRDIVVYIR